MHRILTTALSFCLYTIACYANAESFVIDSHQEDYQKYTNKLPRGESSLSFDLELNMPTSEYDVPSFYLQFSESKGRHSVSLLISDTGCTGEYNSKIGYTTKKGALAITYFESLSPWPDTIEITLIANKKGGKNYIHTLSINDEKQVVNTKKRLKMFAMKVKGKAEINNLKIIKEK